MKRIIFAILMTVIMILAIPASAFAAAPQSAVYHHPGSSQIAVSIDIMATGRSIDHYVQIGKKYALVTGTVYYASIPGVPIYNTNIPELMGAQVQAQESYYYILDQDSNVIWGKVFGDMQIYTLSGDVASMTFKADVWGNVGEGGIAGDIGTWKATSVTGSLSYLKRAKGDWTAVVAWNPLYQTFLGQAQVNGTY